MKHKQINEQYFALDYNEQPFDSEGEIVYKQSILNIIPNKLKLVDPLVIYNKITIEEEKTILEKVLSKKTSAFKI